VTKSFEYTRSVLLTLNAQIEDEVGSLGGNAGLERILGALGVPEEEKVGSKVEVEVVAHEKNGNRH